MLTDDLKKAEDILKELVAGTRNVGRQYNENKTKIMTNLAPRDNIKIGK